MTPRRLVMSAEEVNLFLISLKELTTEGTVCFLVICFLFILVGNLIHRHVRYQTLRPYTTYFVNSFLAFAIFILSIELNIVQMGMSLLGLTMWAVVIGVGADRLSGVVFSVAQDEKFISALLRSVLNIKRDLKDEVLDEKKD